MNYASTMWRGCLGGFQESVRMLFGRPDCDRACASLHGRRPNLSMMNMSSCSKQSLRADMGSLCRRSCPTITLPTPSHLRQLKKASRRPKSSRLMMRPYRHRCRQTSEIARGQTSEIFRLDIITSRLVIVSLPGFKYSFDRRSPPV